MRCSNVPDRRIGLSPNGPLSFIPKFRDNYPNSTAVHLHCRLFNQSAKPASLVITEVRMAKDLVNPFGLDPFKNVGRARRLEPVLMGIAACPSSKRHL
jgi:hypothetical protein